MKESQANGTERNRKKGTSGSFALCSKGMSGENSGSRWTMPTEDVGDEEEEEEEEEIEKHTGSNNKRAVSMG